LKTSNLRKSDDNGKKLDGAYTVYISRVITQMVIFQFHLEST